MKSTSSAWLPLKSSRCTVLSVTTSVSAKSGATVPSVSMVDSVRAMRILLCSQNWMRLEKSRLLARHGKPKVLISQPSSHAAARRAVQKANLDQERLIDFLKRVLFFGQRSSQRAQAHRAAIILLNNRQQQPAVNLVKAMRIYFEHRERGMC